MNSGPNHPFVVWATCFLWIMSMFAVCWSMLLFFCVGDLLLWTGTDLINAFVLLSAIIMFPVNVSMLCSISRGRKIDHRAKVACCPLWLSIVWIVIINTVAAIICLVKIISCRDLLVQQLLVGMKSYRSVPKYKRFLDNIQWSLKCCGLESYKDWFTLDWYDKVRDYDWEPSLSRKTLKRNAVVADSVPLSCCKSGTCVSNYLTELGTYSINTSGCGPVLLRIVMLSLTTHFIMFLFVAIIELIVLKLIMRGAGPELLPRQHGKRTDDNVQHIMTMKCNFDDSSGSCQLNPESEEETSQRFADDLIQK